jgi:gluconolactonase
LVHRAEEVFYLSTDRKTLTKVTDDLTRPNGITGTPDGKNLYVSDIDGHKTWRYDIQPDGTLKNKTFICGLGSDGMTIDTAGNLYLTGHGVTVFDPSGKQIDHIAVQEPWTANVCFSGPERKTLFITASKSFYSIRLVNAGWNPAK